MKQSDSPMRDDLARLFRERLADDGTIVLAGHLALLLIVTGMLWSHVSGWGLAWWAAAVVTATAARTAWQWNARRAVVTDRAMVAGLRALLAVQGLSWGVGVMLVIREGLPLEYVAVLLVGFAGLASSAATTLSGDRPALYTFLGGLYVPIMTGLLLAGGGGDYLATAVMIALFLRFVLELQRRAHRALVRQLEATNALRHEEARFRRVVDANIVGIGFWTASGVVHEANDEYLRITGYSRQDLAASAVNLPSMAAPEHAAGDVAVLRQMVAGQPVRPRETEMLRKDGVRVPVVVGAAPLADRMDEGVAFMLDITERKRAEEALRERTAFLESQVQASAEGILIVDSCGRKILQNRRMAELWSIPPDIFDDPDDAKSLAWVIGRVTRPDEFRARVAYLYAHPEEISRDEIHLVDGTVLDRYSAPVHGPAGEYYGRIWIFHDMTEQSRITEAMRSARDLAERATRTQSMFLANMSHEIRTPMNAVLGMVDIVLNTELTPEQRRSLDIVKHSAGSLLSVINDILDYSKLEAGRVTIDAIPFDVQAVVQSTAAMLAVRADEKRVPLILDAAPTLPSWVSGDPARLQEVLTNLLGNAVKFTESGEVVLTVRQDAFPDGRPGMRFEVRDTGIGIPADRLERIFHEFTQGDGGTSRRYGGTGLGLTIAQRLVGLMGGQITVRSTVGRGSTFGFTLPLTAIPRPAAAPARSPVSLAGCTVVVLEELNTSRRVIRETLAGAGARVYEAVDRESLTRTLGEVTQRHTDPVILIAATRMRRAHAWNELAGLKRLVSGVDIRLLMVRDSTQLMDARQCRELEVDGVLAQPFCGRDLLEAVTAVLKGQPAVREAPAPATADGPRRRLRILLAEDNVTNQVVATTMLRGRGHSVDTVINGRDAVTAVAAVDYDLVLMDIQMPEMDGFEATAGIRALGSRGNLPIIALTAHALRGERERCMEHGLDGYLAKPFTAADLFAVVEGSRPAAPPRVEPTTSPSAPVDLSSLRSQLQAAGAEGALDQIVDTFLESAPERLDQLNLALAGGSADDVARAAHAFKSSAGAIGAKPLAALLASVEAAGKSGAVLDRAILALQVKSAATAVLDGLRIYRKQAA